MGASHKAAASRRSYIVLTEQCRATWSMPAMSENLAVEGKRSTRSMVMPAKGPFLHTGQDFAQPRQQR